MATNNFKPGGGRFASGNKFKGRASGGDSQNNRDARSEREPRNFNGDRPERAGKFGGEGKKVFNRSERFTRSGEEGGPRATGDRPRSFERGSFKSGPKFSKPAPYKGGRRADDDASGYDRDQTGRGERRERPGNEESRGNDRPRYGERRNTEGGYAARGERKPYGAKPYQRSFGDDRRSDKPYQRSFGDDRRSDKPAYDKPRYDKARGSADTGEARPVTPARPYQKSFGGDDRRSDKPGYDKPRFDKKAGERSRDEKGERSFNRSRPEGYGAAGDRKPFGRSKPGADRDEKRSFRSRSEEPAEAPNYDLKRFQGRERRSAEKKADEGLIRLNRYIANAGICSRREADTLIAAGEIKVNGEVVTEMGYTVRPEDTVTYGKKRLNREKMVYVLLNKPKDFITTTEDPEGRKTVMDLVGKASKERIFPVGRLDRNTTGLLLFTNDGELAHKLTHPSNNISKIYQVELDKPITRDHFEQIVNGLELEDGKAEVDDLAIIGDSNTFLGIQIHIGKNRIVRRIFEHLGYEVVSLDRVQYAGLTKKDLARGTWRFLNEKEVIRLKYFL
jgi:23S rRNA pseudouridine2605 synthase